MITILTIDSYNQGNRLQNYALSETLKELADEEVRTARVRDFSRVRNRFWYPLGKLKASLKAGGSVSDRRALKFLDFTHRRIPTVQLTPRQVVESDDIVVVGSDQCWNPDWGLGAREDGLQCVFGKASDKKLSYAASFGVSEEQFTQEWKERYGLWLRSFSNISVREKEGVAMVRSFSGKDARLVLDPTMLLTAAQWATIEKRPKDFPYAADEFCLKYLLGKESEGGLAQDHAEYKGMPVYSLTQLDSDVGPEEFMWLIHHAHAVITDSFHGSVFSLLFHKPLFVIRRKDHLADMSSRFDTLKRFSVFGPCMVEDDDVSLAAEQDQQNWDIFEMELAGFRAESLAWLKDALNGCR